MPTAGSRSDPPGRGSDRESAHRRGLWSYHLPCGSFGPPPFPPPMRGRAREGVCRVEKIAVLLDMRGEPQRVLTCQPLGKSRVAAFERLDDPHMVNDRAGRPVVLVNRDLADRAHVD